MTPTHGPEEPTSLSESTNGGWPRSPAGVELGCLPSRRTARSTGDRRMWKTWGRVPTHFDEDTAWTLIADRIEQGEPIEIVRLRQPEGVKGYVMKIDLEPDTPRLYVKLELGSRKVIGRSFHYSEHD